MTDHVFTRNRLYIDHSAADRLNAMVYLSGEYAATQYQRLRDMGITHVVNFTPDDDGCAKEGFTTLKLDLEDGAEVPSSTIETFFAFMDHCEREGHKVLLHCHAGISRTSAFAIAWLMRTQGANREKDLRQMWSAAEARVGQVRPSIMPHYLLKRSILAYFEGVAA